MKGAIHFRSLTDDCIASVCRLSTQSGWNQTEEDWRRLTRLNPEGVKVWQDAGEIRASFSVIHYQ